MHCPCCGCALMLMPATREENARRAIPAPTLATDRGLRFAEVALMLGVGRSTVYQIPWLRERAYRPTAGGRGLRIKQSDVALYQHLRTAAADLK